MDTNTGVVDQKGHKTTLNTNLTTLVRPDLGRKENYPRQITATLSNLALELSTL